MGLLVKAAWSALRASRETISTRLTATRPPPPAAAAASDAETLAAAATAAIAAAMASAAAAVTAEAFPRRGRVAAAFAAASRIPSVSPPCRHYSSSSSSGSSSSSRISQMRRRQWSRSYDPPLSAEFAAEDRRDRMPRSSPATGGWSVSWTPYKPPSSDAAAAAAAAGGSRGSSRSAADREAAAAAAAPSVGYSVPYRFRIEDNCIFEEKRALKLREATVEKVIKEFSVSEFLRKNQLATPSTRRISRAEAVMNIKEIVFKQKLGYEQMGTEEIDPQEENKFEGWKSTFDWVLRQHIEVETMSAFPLPAKRDPIPKRVDVDLTVKNTANLKVINWIDPNEKVVF